MKITLPNLRQFKRYWVYDEHETDNGTDYADKSKASVIYVLYIEEVVAYIGKSTNVWQRIENHKQSPTKSFFTSFAFYKFEHATKEQLRVYEASYIDKYKPIRNKNVGCYKKMKIRSI